MFEWTASLLALLFIGLEAGTPARDNGTTVEWSTMAKKPTASSKNRCGIDGQHLLNKLRTSVNLTDNIVTALGSMRNKPWPNRLTEVYRALGVVLDCVKHRKLFTLDMLSSAKTMMGKNPHQQYTILFQNLKRFICKEGRAAVDMWLDALNTRAVNIDHAEVDLLKDIDVDSISEPLRINNRTLKLDNADTVQRMGKTFADIFSCVITQNLTQPLVAAIILHIPIEDVKPEMREALTYLADLMREDKIDNWSKMVSTIPKDSKRHPIWFVRSILQILADRKYTYGYGVSDAAETCLNYVHPPTPWSVNPNLAIMSAVVSHKTIDIRLLLSQITPQDFPPDVISSRDALTEAIDVGELDVTAVIKGLNHFQDDAPLDLIISLLNRIRRRMANNLPKALLDSVKSLNSFAMYKAKAMQWNSVTKPRTVAELMILLDSTQSPSLPETVRTPARQLAVRLPQEHPQWNKILQSMDALPCHSPRKCLVLLLNNVTDAGHLSDTKSATYAVALLNSLDPNGEPKDLPTSTLPSRDVVLPHLDTRPIPRKLGDLYPNPTSPIHTFLAQDDLLHMVTIPSNISHHTRGQLLVVILKQALHARQVHADPRWKKVITNYLTGIDAITQEELVQINRTQEKEQLARMENIPDYPGLKDLLKTGGDRSKKDLVVQFLNRSDLPYLLGASFKPQDILTRGKLLEGLLNHALNVQEVKTDRKLMEAIRSYRQQVTTTGVGSEDVVWLWNKTRNVDTDKAFDAVVANGMDDDMLKSLARVYSFLHSALNREVYLSGFNVFVVKTYGELMKRLLQHLLDNDKIDEGLRKDVGIVLRFVDLEGPGEEPMGPIENKPSYRD